VEEPAPKVKATSTTTTATTAAAATTAATKKAKPKTEEESPEDKPKMKLKNKSKSELETVEKPVEEPSETMEAKEEPKPSKLKEKIILPPDMIHMLETLGRDINDFTEDEQRQLIEANVSKNRESIPWFFELKQNTNGEQETLADESIDINMLEINVDIPDSM